MNVSEMDQTTIIDALEVIAGLNWREDRARYVRTYSAGRVDYDTNAREVYSYGRHFPLFRYLSRKVTGRAPVFLINGDEWRGPNSRTRDHQSVTRAAIGATGIPSIVIPFSALDGAGLVRDSVRIVATREDSTWDEDRAVRSLAEVPLHMRRVSFEVPRESDNLESVPPSKRSEYRAPTAAEVAERLERDHRHSNPEYWSSMPILPDADGVYHWKESRQRDLAPDADGLYRWTVRIHRLGDSLFSAVRDIREEDRPARPFETARHTTRETVTITDPIEGRQYCRAQVDSGAPYREMQHETGPSGACIHCERDLVASSVWHRRARYLSSFDTNENPPLYFLAEVPRASGDTVETALDSLAPRAVHAAMARGRDVRRQGDIFLIDTDLTTETLEDRGATFARLTQWTRGARARRGEVNYRPNPTAAERRRESRHARRLWLQVWRGAVADATNGTLPRGRPVSDAGARRAWSVRREEYALEVSRARAELRRLTLAGPLSSRRGRLGGSGTLYVPYGDTYRRAYRRAHRSAVVRARKSLERILERGPRDANGNHSRAHARDNYRARYGKNALAAWSRARHESAIRFRPHTVDGSELSRGNLERARAHLAVYGTAHSATRVARVRGAVYVSGIVSHVPGLEPGRGGDPDHRPIVLTPDRWYLAVRNTVPRQSRKRRGRA